MHSHTLLSSLVVLALGLGSQAQAQEPSHQESPPAEPPLHILLTNDDGIAGAGLIRLRDTLCEAGYRVSISAPLTDRSGISGALTLNQAFRVNRTEFMCGGTVSQSWGVGGTPSDAVLFGLSALGADRPDLVISGMNSGQNVGRAVGHSGTVGAAVTAAEEGVPSLAVSIGLNFDDADSGFSQTTAAAPHAAAYVKSLIEKLRKTAGSDGRLLPDRVALNLNYPVVLGADGLFNPALVKAPRVTSLGRGEVVHPQYVLVGTNPDVYFAVGNICGLQVACDAETVLLADTTALAQGAISITPLEVDGTPRPLLRSLLNARLHVGLYAGLSQ